MQNEPQELAVITKTYELLLWTANHVAKFPRSHRFTVGDRLDNHVNLVLDKLLRAKYDKNRAPFLREANMELEIARIQFRLSKDLRLLSLDSYGFAARCAVEIGQQIGGWLRHNERGR